MTKPKTLKELKKSGHKSLSVKDELRRNLIEKLKKNETLFPGIIGYDKTVIPQLVNAILSKHDFILLGLRGQAKTRILRALANLLDEEIPVIKGCPINDDPFKPACIPCAKRLETEGDDLEIEWVSREARYQEKLATPDITIADLIGDIDPIKAAREKLDFSDEQVIHYGIIPRTNRGIFAINELPDLQPRLQVGLLNIMEEKDIQIRGFPIRMPLDILLVYSANPEDYTNRGNIITPLKDRIDSQIMTHYPQALEDAMAITTQEAWTERGVKVCVPEFFKEIIEEIAFSARKSEYVDQTSGVSARLPISALENLVSNIEKRALKTKDKNLFPRVCDLIAVVPSVTGKIELVYEGEQEGPAIVAFNLVGRAVKEVFGRYFPEVPKSGAPSGNSQYAEILKYFSSGQNIELSDEAPFEEYIAALNRIPGLRKAVEEHLPPGAKEEIACRMELVLEGLHQHNLIGKETFENAFRYTDMLSTMLRGMED
ncbi:MAG: magnesium chelatase [candidate division Zixibacteria bacterium RBG_16_50_21]|nr:MAG: magnesium chelatase [candidate division Zixibacteria bacterium RBG_16_50_21]